MAKAEFSLGEIITSGAMLFIALIELWIIYRKLCQLANSDKDKKE